MKKSLTRKLTIAVIALVFAVVSLSTSTYAWFTMSNEAQINAFESQVKAGEGIEIAVTSTDSNTGAQWYTGNVPDDVVKTAFEANKFNQFDALTTLDLGKSFVDKDGNSYTADANEVGYVSFYVHIKTAEVGTVNLTEIKLSSTGKGVDPAWPSDAAYYLPKGTNGIEKGDLVNVNSQVNYKVEDAIRISIVNGENSKVFEKAEGNGENNFAGVKSEYGAFSYYNSKNQDKPIVKRAAVDGENKINYSDYTADTIKLNNTSGDGVNVENVELGTTTQDKPIITFKVNIWVEGWDTECLNAIFAQTLSVRFNFKYTETVQG